MKKDNKLKPVYTSKELSILLGIPHEVLINLSENCQKKYKPFKKKKQNGEYRTIDNPIAELKTPQKRIKDRILEKVPLSPEILGGVKGRSIKDYAAIHLNQKQVVCLDIKNCFPSVSNKMVFEVFRNQLKFSKDVSSILTKLTTYRYHLPQGAPSSTSLLNIIINPMALEITDICKKSKLNVSFWVDDITISGVNAREIIQEIVPIIHKYGFSIKANKTSITYDHQKQSALGIGINKKLKINSKKYDKYISDLFDPNLNVESIRGKIEHLKFINQNQAQRFIRFAKKRLSGRLEYKE